MTRKTKGYKPWRRIKLLTRFFLLWSTVIFSKNLYRSDAETFLSTIFQVCKVPWYLMTCQWTVRKRISFNRWHNELRLPWIFSHIFTSCIPKEKMWENKLWNCIPFHSSKVNHKKMYLHEKINSFGSKTKPTVHIYFFYKNIGDYSYISFFV